MDENHDYFAWRSACVSKVKDDAVLFFRKCVMVCRFVSWALTHFLALFLYL